MRILNNLFCRDQCSMFSVQCSVFNVQCSMFKVQSSTFNVKCSMFNIQCSMFLLCFFVLCFDAFIRPRGPVKTGTIHAQFAGVDENYACPVHWGQQKYIILLALLLEFIPYGMQVYMLANHRRSGWAVIHVKAFALACGCPFTLPCVMW